MTTTTTNLNLVLYNQTTDQSGSFITWQQDMSGSSNSNMTKIDNYSGSASGSITAYNTSVSGSLTTISGSMNNISGSLTTIMSDIANLNLRFAKIGEFSGAGLPDFTDISGSYTHLLVIGVAKVSYNSAGVDLGIDFNGDANSGNYSAFEWYRSNSFDDIHEYVMGGITVSTVPGNNATSYGGPFLFLVPNYSANGGFYKNAMGISARYAANYEAAISGGVWKSTVPITRLRVFGSVGSTSTRQSFMSGTKISVYGIG